MALVNGFFRGAVSYFGYRVPRGDGSGRIELKPDPPTAINSTANAK